MKFKYIFALLALLTMNCALAQNPYLKKDDAWISISGKVESVKPDQFTLNYGEGKVTVEMDDGDRDADAYKLLKGDKVTVSGFIDKDFFEKTKIEASSVYVENLGVTFYSSSIDEEDFNYYGLYVTTPIVPGAATIYGRITSVDGREFTLKTPLNTKLEVNTSDMVFNPMDKQGYIKIKKGDYVRVSGKMTSGLFKDDEFNANSIVKFSNI